MDANTRGPASHDVTDDRVKERLTALETQVASLRTLVGELLALYDAELRRDGG